MRTAAAGREAASHPSEEDTVEAPPMEVPPLVEVSGSEWPLVNGRYRVVPNAKGSEPMWQHQTTTSTLIEIKGRYVIRSSDAVERSKTAFYACTQEIQGPLLGRKWFSVATDGKNKKAAVPGLELKQVVSAASTSASSLRTKKSASASSSSSRATPSPVTTRKRDFLT
jgi:hypothetical protein